MKRFCLTGFALLLLCAAQTHADTDYICLKACVDNGGTHTLCMPKCAYDSSSTPLPDQPQANSACLKTCVDGGAAPAACVPQCTDVTLQSSVSVSQSAIGTHTSTTTHNVFNAPIPFDGVMLPQQSGKVMSTEDYTCMKICTQGHLQYKLCQQRCARPVLSSVPAQH